MNLLLLNRYQAAFIHIAISLAIFVLLLICITQYWYPGILFDTGNGWKAVGMIVGIDLILGPLLTFLVFNPKKKSLKLDLAIIAIIQTAALAYGTWTIHHTRPVAIAFVNTNFITIFANSLLGEQLLQKTRELETLELYYIFDDNNPSSTLIADQFDSYKNHVLKVKETKPSNDNHLLINIDPLMSPLRFIQVDSKTGKILRFVKK
jgi:hypothetical protein